MPARFCRDVRQSLSVREVKISETKTGSVSILVPTAFTVTDY
jgi:hypothetical protein